MRKSTKIDILKVAKEYHKMFKVEAAKKGMSMLEYSRYLAKKAKDETREKEAFKFGF